MKIDLKSDKGLSILMYMVYMIALFLVVGVVVYTAIDSGVFFKGTKERFDYDNQNIVAENVVENTVSSENVNK